MFGNLGGLGNIANLIKSAQGMQERFAKMQEELARRRFDGDAGGGMVKATVDGRGALVNIKINPDAARDVELLEDLVQAAIGAAASKAQETMKADVSALTGGVSIPGLTEMLGGK